MKREDKGIDDEDKDTVIKYLHLRVGDDIAIFILAVVSWLFLNRVICEMNVDVVQILLINVVCLRRESNVSFSINNLETTTQRREKILLENIKRQMLINKHPHTHVKFPIIH